jgi:hypothetical protein
MRIIAADAIVALRAENAAKANLIDDAGDLYRATHKELVAARARIAALRHDIERHVAHAAELAGEVERMRQDAARYRWLRVRNDGDEIDPPGPFCMLDDKHGSDYISGAALDAAIDAALAAKAGA